MPVMVMLDPSPDIVQGIIGKLKTNGMFDQMRRSCLADIDTKPAFQNLKQRVENYVNALLSAETWTPSLNKNQLRTKVRSSVMRSGMLNSGVEHILHQVVDAKMYTEFLPMINDFISENHEAVLKELTPQLEQNEGVIDSENPSNEELSAMQTISQGLDFVENSEATNSNQKNQESVPDIPEGAANTIRNLIQSLMTTNIQSLLTMGNENEEIKEANQNKTQGYSPSIGSSQIESFTDEEGDQAKANPNDVGPRTPEESENSPSASESVNVSPDNALKSDQPDLASSSEAEEEDLRKVHSDASFDSSGGNPEKSDCEVVINDDGSEDEGAVEDEHDVDNEQSFSFDEDRVNIVNVDDEFDNDSMNEMEVMELAGSENVELGGNTVVEDQQNLEVGEIAVAEQSEEEEETVEVVRHSHREKKRKHKKHRRRRHSTDEDSEIASRSERDSSEDVRMEGAEASKSRSRKKKKKKRSKKLKRSRTRESSLERLQWDSSSEYKRSSHSPPHPEMAQLHSFVPSPISQPPVRFGDENRNVKVEPAFMQMTPHFRDPYASERGLPEKHSQENPEHPFQHPKEGMIGYPARPNFPPRSPPHFPPHMRPRYSPPRFSHGPSRFSPPYARMPYPMRPGSPPRGRYSPTFEYYRHRHPVHHRFEGPPRSPPPHQRRFSPPRQLPRFPGSFPPPPPRGFPSEERFMLRPSAAPAPRSLPPAPAARPQMPENPHPPMR